MLPRRPLRSASTHLAGHTQLQVRQQLVAQTQLLEQTQLMEQTQLVEQTTALCGLTRPEWRTTVHTDRSKRHSPRFDASVPFVGKGNNCCLD